MKLFSVLEKSRDFWFLVCPSFIFFLLRLPSLFEPYWYGDEGIYQTLGIAINAGRILYKDIWDNKPPLLYILYAIFHGDQFSLRLLSLIFGILSIIVFFFLAKKLFFLRPNLKRTTTPLFIYLSTALFAFLFALPLFEGNIANAENFMILPVLTAAFLIVHSLEKPTNKAFFYAGLLLSLAFLLKIVAIFDIAAFAIFLLIVNYSSIKTIGKEVARFLPLLYGFLLPLLITVLFFVTHNALGQFVNATFQQNVGYVGYGNTFIVPQGLLYIKLVLLLALVFFLWYKRKLLSPSALFIYIWLSFSVFNAFFSQRPYTHYLLVLLPSFCLFTGLLLSNFAAVKLRQKNISFIYISSIVYLFLIILVYRNFDTYKKNLAYYQNFIAYILNQKSLPAYQEFFDTDVPKDYAIAQFLKTHTDKNDVVFVWGNPAQIYKMSETLPPGRYTVAYHVTNSRKSLEETSKVIKQKKPKFIVLISSRNYPFSLSGYRFVFSIQGSAIYEYLF